MSETAKATSEQMFKVYHDENWHTGDMQAVLGVLTIHKRTAKQVRVSGPPELTGYRLTMRNTDKFHATPKDAWRAYVTEATTAIARLEKELDRRREMLAMAERKVTSHE